MDGSAEEAERLWPPEGPEERDPGLFPWPFHPEEGGLLLWGSDEQGSSYYFRPVEPDPDAWRIVVRSECGGWFETAGTFSEFIVRCFDRIDRPPFIARDWPGTAPSHHQADPGR
ncbi:hypothetical protein [Streptomyces sp. cmx-18-6]|uniref:hypothetical protein n=1 Tax=Streptomyces sp. cmx-18-6 TaxID=2790930 RepID=UPI003980CF79